MTNDSHRFRTVMQLEADGFYPVQGNRWKGGEELYLPLYQGRMIQNFDHRANSVRVNPESKHNPYLSEPVSDAQRTDPGFPPATQYWVPAIKVGSILPQSGGWGLGFRDICRPTDARTLLASIVPWAGYGNKLPLLLADRHDLGSLAAAKVVANMNSACMDFVVSQKIHGTSLN